MYGTLREISKIGLSKESICYLLTKTVRRVFILILIARFSDFEREDVGSVLENPIYQSRILFVFFLRILVLIIFGISRKSVLFSAKKFTGIVNTASNSASNAIREKNSEKDSKVIEQLTAKVSNL